MMTQTIRRLSFMTVLLGTMLIFAFAGAEAYAANVIMDENTTQLENGNTYVIGGTVKCSDRINVQEESVVRLNITNKGELNARKGIHVPPGSTLIIGGLGTLTAKGSNECAGTIRFTKISNGSRGSIRTESRP